MKIKKIYNDLFPFKGSIAMTVFELVFIRNDKRHEFTAKGERHETTHTLQQYEVTAVGAMLAVLMQFSGCGWWSLLPFGLFFEWYLLEWLVKIPFCRFDTDRAYRSIAFEQEAYEHQDEFGYNNVRKHFKWIRYIFTLTPKET